MLSYTGVYSTYDDLHIVDGTKPSPHNISIACYSEHDCLHHKVHIVWFINVNKTQQEPFKYFAFDSDLLYSEFGMSITSTCPAYQCQSTLTLPSDEKLNNTEISCGAYTEVCPGVIKFRSNTVTVITKENLVPPTSTSKVRSTPPISATASSPTPTPISNRVSEDKPGIHQ